MEKHVPFLGQQLQAFEIKHNWAKNHKLIPAVLSVFPSESPRPYLPRGAMALS
jgi:hypothetical protein